MTTFELLTCVLLVFMSGYIAASEIALFSLSRFQIRALKERIRPATHKRIKRLLQDPGGLLVTLLVLNEVINIALSSLITESIATPTTGNGPLFENWIFNLLAGTAITTPIVLLLCEITPKAIGARANQLVATATAGPLSMIYAIFKPIRLVLKRLVAWISRHVSATPPSTVAASEEEKTTPRLKESEFLEMVEEGHKEGAIQQSELDLIKNVFELDDARVVDIFTPISQVQTLSAKKTIRDALSAMKTRKFSRIPVVVDPQSKRPEVLGILYTKDLLRAHLEPSLMDTPISELMRKPPVVNPSMQLNALFRKFKAQRTHMAIVQRLGGETLGVVTMDDVLDSLFDDLLEEEEHD